MKTLIIEINADSKLFASAKKSAQLFCDSLTAQKINAEIVTVSFDKDNSKRYHI